MIKNGILARYKKIIKLDTKGYKFLKLQNIDYNKFIYQEKSIERLKFISHMGAIYFGNANVTFTPSFEMKKKEIFTETSRRYKGMIKVFGIRYLIYHISKNNDKKYINSVIYDIQKETTYKNIIVFIDDIDRINLSDFIFRSKFCDTN